jgi:16S rRNA (adenine1518-N6/adenine1519-N6)-dimethyltransferase
MADCAAVRFCTKKHQKKRYLCAFIILKKKKLKAKKSYGQHFLTQEPIAERIAKSLTRTADYDMQVLEVGPGKGMLTKYLLAENYNLLCVEADKDMVDFLNKQYPKMLKGRVIGADFMKIPLEDYYSGQFAIIGNFPYNISSQIIFKAIDYRAQVVEVVGMFQHEMAVRVCAKPGSKDYGVITILTQAYYDCEYLFSVHHSAFAPPPRVESAVIRLVRKPEMEIACDATLFRTIVKLAFGQRRKMLRNTMRALIESDEVLQEPFFNERPEQLSVQAFIDLTNRVAALRKA